MSINNTRSTYFVPFTEQDGKYHLYFPVKNNKVSVFGAKNDINTYQKIADQAHLVFGKKAKIEDRCSKKHRFVKVKSNKNDRIIFSKVKNENCGRRKAFEKSKHGNKDFSKMVSLEVSKKDLKKTHKLSKIINKAKKIESAKITQTVKDLFAGIKKKK